ncbi:UDP-glucose/GDP-mannose dehydrogenase family protein [Alginatibacterium sediminis]|uniref:UDP-glucose 6-dehydrogenase n=1 Tax=Alginatibacterium sediminis TaxID=2164068 RepID=A0A420E7E1_9ALTE|nr:UDP-glucose/GDP-mannose dehydrogenase family protein [Alginatibacterium sediminis]RKF14394.1 UDP-glucose/GDP-mannose dehydrogenase family protein [Alginatibacterium sediminis]
MEISIFGLGYVGAVSAGCLVKDGHTVIGVDTSDTKVSLINAGNSPIIEQDIDKIIATGAKSGSLSATTDCALAIKKTSVSMICVGTPSQLNGSLDLKYVRRVCEQIGEEIKNKDDYHVVVIRSTMLPGTMRDIVQPTLEDSSGKTAGVGFGLAINPEFLREGTAVYDYYNPPKTVVGANDKRTQDIVLDIYAHLPGPKIGTDLATAEMVKYSDNVWHALKVAFANEIGNISKKVNVDSHKVMDIFCQDTKLNISSYYMKPGFAFGGSCLPKDVRALVYKARSLDVDVPVLASILPSNELQVNHGLELITEKNKRKIGILGFSFKAGTDDLRESPVVEVIERLIGKGYDLRLYDKNVSIASVVGANRDYILNRIPHISRLMVDSEQEVIDHAEVLVIGNSDPNFKQAVKSAPAECHIVDLVRIINPDDGSDLYEGICW